MTTFSDMVYVNGGVPLLPGNVTTGNVWFVDSGATNAADTATNGKSAAYPFATLDYAIGS